MKTRTDSVNDFFKKALDILFLKQPVRTAFGVIVGIVLHSLSIILAPVWPELGVWTSALTIWHYIAFGILAINIPEFSKNKFDPSIERAFSAIEKAEKEGRFTKEEIKLLYHEVLTKVIEEITVKSDEVNTGPDAKSLIKEKGNE